MKWLRRRHVMAARDAHATIEELLEMVFNRDKYWSFSSFSVCILIAIFNVNNTHINVFFLLTSVALPFDNVYGL
jgi:hypothetical protein